MEATDVTKKFEIKKWNAVALWAWGEYTQLAKSLEEI